MKQIKIFVTSAVLLFLFSCEKDNLFDPDFNWDGILLKEVDYDGNAYYKYTYNDDGFVLEEKSKFHYVKHKYDSRNQLIQSSHYWDERIASSSSYILDEAMQRTEWVNPENTERVTYSSFIYSKSGQLEKYITVRDNNNSRSYSTFKYNTHGQIERRTFYHDDEASQYDEYFYDNKGNLIKTERYSILENGTSELITTTEYEFDNKYNPYYSFRRLFIPGQNTNHNNIIKETYTLHFNAGAFIEPVQVTEYNYEYNSEGYPVKRSDSFEYLYY